VVVVPTPVCGFIVPAHGFAPAALGCVLPTPDVVPEFELGLALVEVEAPTPEPVVPEPNAELVVVEGRGPATPFGLVCEVVVLAVVLGNVLGDGHGVAVVLAPGVVVVAPGVVLVLPIPVVL